MRNGIDMGNMNYDRKVLKNNKTDMFICPASGYRSYIRAIDVIRVFATGWKHLQNNNELQLFISDHVDWDDIIYSIEKIKPKEIWTTHGSGIQLKSYFTNIITVKLLN